MLYFKGIVETFQDIDIMVAEEDVIKTGIVIFWNITTRKSQ
ncbi:MAG: hypothetical protein RR139_09405 [Lachnospiraceae bacterium]